VGWLSVTNVWITVRFLPKDRQRAEVVTQLVYLSQGSQGKERELQNRQDKLEENTKTPQILYFFLSSFLKWFFHQSANVFLTKESTVKLGDMNVSKVAKKGLLYTQTGTPYYAR